MNLEYTYRENTSTTKSKRKKKNQNENENVGEQEGKLKRRSKFRNIQEHILITSDKIFVRKQTRVYYYSSYKDVHNILGQ